MNELREKYNPSTYFLNKTHSVYISLDFNKLRIQTTDVDVPKRAIANETIPKPNFTEQRIYDLKGKNEFFIFRLLFTFLFSLDCEVIITPTELVRKRFWSKKYPICLKKIKLISKSSSVNETTSTTASDNNLVTKDDDKFFLDNQLILFARCDREKEEWFNLFKKASKNQLPSSYDYMKSTNVLNTSNTKTTNQKTDNSLISNDIASSDYPSQKITNEQSDKQHSEQKIDHEKTLKFLNIFLMRSFSGMLDQLHLLNLF